MVPSRGDRQRLVQDELLWPGLLRAVIVVLVQCKLTVLLLLCILRLLKLLLMMLLGSEIVETIGARLLANRSGRG